MKIALYTEGIPFTGDTPERRALGGSESAFVAVARELARLGHDVTAYCRSEATGVYDGVTYRDLAGACDLGRIDYDLFICSRYFAIFDRPIRARATFLWLHDQIEPSLAPALAIGASRVDLIYTLTHYHRAQTAAVVPALEPRLRVIHNGYDPQLVTSAIDGAQKRHRIMYTSRPERGLLRALDLYERLDDRTLELLVCTYPYAASEAIAAIEATCRRRIEELATRGFLIRTTHFAKPALYRAISESKAVLYPTNYPETSCISAIEAQACGTAFITTDDFALRESVGYPGIGRDDSEGFRQRLLQLLAEQELRQALETRGRMHVAPWTWQAVARRFADDAVRTLERPRVAEPRSGALQSSAHPPWPRVSCLTVTRGRIRLLKRAIAHYCAQVYPHKELIIVAQGDARYRQALSDHLTQLGRADIRLQLCSDDGATLGRLRNLSIELASGELVCQWDDDDCYHRDRLQRQVECLLRAKATACYLTDHLQLIERDRAVHWVDWAAMSPHSSDKWHFAPGTLLMVKNDRFRYPESGPSATRGEDTALLDSLFGAVPIAALRDAGHLYLYTFHGRNTFSEQHHRALSVYCKTAPFVREKQVELGDALRQYALPRPLIVYGGGEPLFAING